MGKLRTKAVRFCAVAVAVVATIAVGASSPASAGGNGGVGTVNVGINVVGTDAANVLDGLVVELFDGGTDVADALDLCTQGSPNVFSVVEATRSDTCENVPAQPTTYTLGIEGAPDDAIVRGFCFVSDSGPDEMLTDPSATFEIGPFQTVQCVVDVLIPTLFVDKVVDDSNGGTAGPGDFSLEVYSGGSQVATATDTSTETCGGFADVTGCATVPLALGDYQLGETPAPGYLPTNVSCQPFFPQVPAEIFPSGIGTFTLGNPFTAEEGDPFAYCEVTNRYFEGDLVVQKVVVNDDGGTAAPEDFTAEVFTEPGGSAVTSETCAADGSCIDTTVAIGSYRIGESGPDGYTATVSCTVTREPDPPAIGTTPPDNGTVVILREALPGPDAVADVEPFGEVTCIITNDDVPPTTTTTTTTTTTLPPTTTTISGLLPETGSEAGRTSTLMLLAIGFLVAGGSLLAVRRR